jgi:hypothetical protein
MCFEISDINVSLHNKFILKENNEYLNTKFLAFEKKDCGVSNFERFSERPSLRNIGTLSDLSGSIYTVACQMKNGDYYEDLINRVIHLLSLCPDSRRIVLRFVDDIKTLYDSQFFNNIDVSCLMAIHYHKNSCKLIFRASDVRYEIVPDIFTIFYFFIKNVYFKDCKIDSDFKITFLSSTTQNVKYFKESINIIEKNF